MAAKVSSLRASDSDSDVDANVLALDITGSSTTPDTELSPPASPLSQTEHLKDKRLAARSKLARLTQDEKVWGPVETSLGCCGGTAKQYKDIPPYGGRLLENKGAAVERHPGSKGDRRPKWGKGLDIRRRD